MKTKYVLFINPEKAKGFTNPFNTDYQVNGFEMGEENPIWFSETTEIAVIWDREVGNYRSTCKEAIKQKLQVWANNENSYRIGVALHGNSREKTKESQEKILKDHFGSSVVIKEYHKEEGMKPYCLFCDALLRNNVDRVQQALKELDSFFFKPKTHDKALELLTEWLPDFLGGTVPGNHDKSKQLWEDFKRQVELVDQGAKDATANDTLFREIEALVEEVEEAGGYGRFSEKYESLYHKLGAFIER